MSEPQSLSPTPVKYPGLSLLAKGLAGVNSFATAEDKAVPGKKANALLSGLASMVGLPEAQALMEKLAYGERLTTGKGQTLKPAENVVEGALALAPLAQGLARGAVKVAGKIPTQLDSSPNALVWHGSPHQFDKFDSSKIGTGEGAQAYGHGLYLAESPKVADSYKKALSPGNGLSDDDTLVRALGDDADLLQAALELERRAKYANMPGGKERLLGLAEKLRSGYDPRGSLYKVDLPDEQIGKMLDWDKPLSAQPDNVQKGLAQSESVRAYMAAAENQRLALNASHPLRLEKIPSAGKPYDATRMTGKDAQVALAREYGNQKLVSGRLKELGIPGLRYLDGSSRNMGDGTSNFVVFPGNESFLQILERNGIPLNKGLAGK